MTCLAANNASARLATSVTVEDLAIQLSTGEGAMFPTPTAGDYFMITVFEQTGDAFNMEIMKCTHRDGDVLTVARAQEGTSAVAFSVSGRVENRFTAGMYNAMGDEVRAIAQSVQQQLDGKQDTLTFDATPTAGSSNPVTSDGIHMALIASSGYKQFTSNGMFTVPSRVSAVFALIQAGGGGGGGALYSPYGYSANAGGGAGGMCVVRVSVSPGEQVPVTVGVGGAAGIAGQTSAANGGNGGTSSFGGHYATGGNGGASSVGGTGGSTSIATQNLGIEIIGGAGKAPSDTVGGAGGYSSTAYGSGGRGANGGPASAGASGSPGVVFVWW